MNDKRHHAMKLFASVYSENQTKLKLAKRWQIIQQLFIAYLIICVSGCAYLHHMIYLAINISLLVICVRIYAKSYHLYCKIKDVNKLMTHFFDIGEMRA